LHGFAHPDTRQAMQQFYGTLLGCSVRELDFGLKHPIMLITTAGGSFSVEFVDDASDPEQPWRGAWIEFITDDVPALQQRLRDAKTPEFRHPGAHTCTSARRTGKCCVFSLRRSSNRLSGLHC